MSQPNHGRRTLDWYACSVVAFCRRSLSRDTDEAREPLLGLERAAAPNARSRSHSFSAGSPQGLLQRQFRRRLSFRDSAPAGQSPRGQARWGQVADGDVILELPDDASQPDSQVITHAQRVRTDTLLALTMLGMLFALIPSTCSIVSSAHMCWNLRCL